MMDGRNCIGRKISLLNDDSRDTEAALSSKIQLAPLTAPSRASSSCDSTPSLSPQTPQLVLSCLSDSRSFATPSPLTPSFNTFEGATQSHNPKHQSQQYYINNHSYSKMDEQGMPMYPPLPDAPGTMPQAYPMPPQMPQQMQPQPNQPVYRSSNSPASEPSHLSNVSATSNAKAQPKKNQYPCPMAKQVGCTDYFTTSGHAARHAKKHTGKKDAFCPECNKAFTRKDNMEQHRRTHQNGRGASRSNNNSEESKRVTKPQKTSAKKPNAKAEQQQFEAAVEQQLADRVSRVPMQMQTQNIIQATQAQQAMAQPVLDQQALMMPPSGPYFLPTVDTGPIPSLPNAMPNLNIRPRLHRTNFATSLDFIPPSIPTLSDPDPSHYSYPSPGLSNGLNSLALAASEHRRLSEEKSQSQSPKGSPS